MNICDNTVIETLETNLNCDVFVDRKVLMGNDGFLRLAFEDGDEDTMFFKAVKHGASIRIPMKHLYRSE